MDLPAIGQPFAGGFLAGLMNIDGQRFALIVAPKSEGERNGRWIDDYKPVPDARSYFDGPANTAAMAEAGSEIAQWARGLTIGDFADWYLPSQDELELCYRALKPTADKNARYARSGINLSAEPPTRPYTQDSPVQTSAEAFRAGGEQAFEAAWYWSSTQHAEYSDFAWLQNFSDGYQYYVSTSYEGRARAVRRLAI